MSESRRVGLALKVIPVLLVALAAAGPARGSLISYEVHNVSGDRWQYTYTVSNEYTFDAFATGFSVYFDSGLFENLEDLSSADPAAWSLLTLQPDTELPADGLLDALAQIEFAPGSTSGSSFAVAFDWLGGSATPGSQPWEIYELDELGGLTVLESGTTSPQLPEPGGAVLLACSLLVLLVARKAP